LLKCLGACPEDLYGQVIRVTCLAGGLDLDLGGGLLARISTRSCSVAPLPWENPMTAPTSTRRCPEPFGCTFHGVGLDADRRDAITGCDPAAGVHLLVRHRRVQERVIDHLGKLFAGGCMAAGR
jgi:hypothetical protein